MPCIFYGGYSGPEAHYFPIVSIDLYNHYTFDAV